MGFGDRSEPEKVVRNRISRTDELLILFVHGLHDLLGIFPCVQPDVIDVIPVVAVAGIFLADKPDDAVGSYRRVLRKVFINSDDLYRVLRVLVENKAASDRVLVAVNRCGDLFRDQYRPGFRKTLRTAVNEFEFQYIQRVGFGGIKVERALTRVFPETLVVDVELLITLDQSRFFDFGFCCEHLFRHQAGGVGAILSVFGHCLIFDPEYPIRIFVMPVERQIVFYLRHDNHERGECDTQPNDVEQRSDFVFFQYVEEIFQRCHDWQAFVVWLFGFNRFYRIVRRGFVAAKRDDRDDDA